MPTQSIVKLLHHVVDYAGLFPPAALTMRDAVLNYARYKKGTESWMLGRFIVPLVRLEEFETEAEPLLPKDSSPWRLSVLAGSNLAEDVSAIREFNERSPGAFIDTIELKATRVEEILTAASLIPKTIAVFVEVPIHSDPLPLVLAVGNAGLKAKVRTGGITADAFPTSKELARFIHMCSEHRVAFKATAGLHHPIRALYNLTYEQSSTKGKMFGFLNLLLASAFAGAGMCVEQIVKALEEEAIAAFRFDDEGITWRSERLSVRDVSWSREALALSFGSCSFQEPADDLRAHNLL